jgi:acetyl-CoA acyltransferase
MSNPRDVVLIDGTRTPFAKAGSKFNNIHASELGRVALKELIARTNLDVNQVDEVIIGNTGSPSDAVNISRVIALSAGIPQKTSAHTVHRNCASAMESIATGFDKIKSGIADVVIAGGTESMSNMPLMFTKEFADTFAKFAGAKSMGQKLGVLSQIKMKYLKPRIAIVEGLTDPFCGLNMGQTAEVLAKEFHISREEQDQFALKSHQKAVAAQKEGRFKDEIVPFFIPPKYKDVVAEDIGTRDGQNMQSLG